MAGIVLDTGVAGSPYSVPNTPQLIFDDFRGAASGSVAGRSPVVGGNTWSVTGAGAGNAYAGAGVMGSTSGNTYFVQKSSATPWEVVSTFSAPSGTPGNTISIVKDYTNHIFTVMWHTDFNMAAGTIQALYWNDTWNGAGATVAAVAPAFQFQGAACPTLATGHNYVSRVRIDVASNTAVSSLEETSGQILCSSIAYDPLLSSLVGPFAFVQTGLTTTTTFSSFAMNSAPSGATATYSRNPSGIDNTPIGTGGRAPALFTSATVGSGNPLGVFSVTWDGTASATPGIWSTTTGNFKIGSLTSGYAAGVTLVNGAGGTGQVTLDGSYNFNLIGYNPGSAGIVLPPNGGAPYSKTSIGVGGSAGPVVISGTGAPAATLPKGSIYLRTDGAVGSTFYVSQGGGTWNAAAGI